MAGDPHFSNVSLLLHMDGANGSTTFTDSSPAPKTVIANGNAQISTAQSRFGGASAYFGDATDLTTPIGPFAFPGDFTVEAWVRPLPGADNVISGRAASPSTGISFRISNNKLTCFYGAGLGQFVSTATVPANEWSHIAISRSGSVARFFINGVLAGSATWSGTINDAVSGNLQIGRYGTAEPYSGYIDDLRITNGVARYTANFTPPAEPAPDRLPKVSGTIYDSSGQAVAGRTVRAYRRDTGLLLGSAITSDGQASPGDPHFSNVSLLLHMDGANGSTTFTDSSPAPKTVIANGNAQISTAQSRFGGASAYFGGATDLTTPIGPFAFPGDFTVEAWVRPLPGADNVISGRAASPSTGISFRVVNNKFTCFYGAGLGLFVSTATVPANEWSHISISRSGSVARFFINGVLDGSATWSGTINDAASGNLQIGRYGTAEPYSGYIEDLRITKGVARYTANFTPPNAAFYNAAPKDAEPLGSYTLAVSHDGEVQVISLDDAAGTTYNDLILRTTPV